VHATFGVFTGRATGQRSKLAGVLGHPVLLDNPILVGPFHFNRPRLFQAELRYHFHF
jgi:hypothetical protein